jgi:Mrp family chromosome partitioning ATPase
VSVLVIDADPSGPSIGVQLGLSHPVDFSDVLSGQAELSAAVLDHPWSHLHLLPSEPGRKPWLRHVGLVGEWRRLLERAQDYDLVIVDAGPILGAPVALMLAPMVDDIVLVARQASTPRHAFDECLAALGGHADKLRATVLTGDAGEG